MNIKSLYKLAKTHVVDSIAGLAMTHWSFAIVENVALGMTDAQSLKARALVTAATFLGMGSVFSRLRDVSRRYFNVTDTTPEKLQARHDILYTMAFNAVTAPVVYLVNGDMFSPSLGGVKL